MSKFGSVELPGFGVNDHHRSISFGKLAFDVVMKNRKQCTPYIFVDLKENRKS